MSLKTGLAFMVSLVCYDETAASNQYPIIPSVQKVKLQNTSLKTVPFPYEKWHFPKMRDEAMKPLLWKKMHLREVVFLSTLTAILF